MSWKHLFLPHPKSHKKARLLSWQAFLVYGLLFFSLQYFFNFVSWAKPGVLGINSNIQRQEIVQYTNQERQKNNLPLLLENSLLTSAAEAKAQNMFEENYWAHYAPSGKDPWGFINASGYKFSYAGENLARNFYTSQEVVAAWMASPAHKDNVLNSRYKEIGIAVVEGVLKGEKTTLVVQMFGTPVEAVALAPPGKPVASLPPTLNSVAGATNVKLSIDSFMLSRNIGIAMLLGLAFLLVFDLYIIRRRGVYRLASRHFPHLILLGLGVSALANMHPGSIL